MQSDNQLRFTDLESSTTPSDNTSKKITKKRLPGTDLPKDLGSLSDSDLEKTESVDNLGFQFFNEYISYRPFQYLAFKDIRNRITEENRAVRTDESEEDVDSLYRIRRRQPLDQLNLAFEREDAELEQIHHLPLNFTDKVAEKEPTISEKDIWKGTYPSSSLPLRTYQERYVDESSLKKIVSTSIPAIEIVILSKVSLGSKSRFKVSPMIARDESLEFVEVKETVFNVGLVPSNQTNEPSLVSVISPVEFPAESSNMIEKLTIPSGSCSNNSLVPMKSLML